MTEGFAQRALLVRGQLFGGKDADKQKIKKLKTFARSTQSGVVWSYGYGYGPRARALAMG